MKTIWLKLFLISKSKHKKINVKLKIFMTLKQKRFQNYLLIPYVY